MNRRGPWRGGARPPWWPEDEEWPPKQPPFRGARRRFLVFLAVALAILFSLVFTAGIILAIMIVPFIASFARDMLDQIPTVLRESAYGIGCTTWEVVRHVLVPQAAVSIIGAIMLGLGRALGETMAVTFVVGNANRLSASIFDPSSTIASRIANEFNEADGLQLNALMALGCILFVITFVVLIIARLLTRRVKAA